MIPQGTIVKLKKGYIGRIYWGVVMACENSEVTCSWKRTRTEAIAEYFSRLKHATGNGDDSKINEQHIEIKQPITKLISWREMLK